MSRTIVVDIDGVLAEDTGRHDDYADRKPLPRGIAMVKKLKAEGNTIILHTARWKSDRHVTARWLKQHGVPYDKLILGKPRADLYIDDRALRWPCSPGDLWRAVNTGRGPTGALDRATQARGLQRLTGARNGHPGPSVDPTETGDPTKE